MDQWTVDELKVEVDRLMKTEMTVVKILLANQKGRGLLEEFTHTQCTEILAELRESVRIGLKGVPRF